MFDMAGTSKEHSIIIVNLTGEFHSALRSKVCQPFSSDLRVKVSANGLYAYPDLTIVCSPIDVEDEQDDVLLNPTLIIEVFSPRTERYDRGKNLISTASWIPSRNMCSSRRINIVRSSSCVDMARNGATASLSRRMTSSISSEYIYARVVFPPEESAPPEA
jgi:Uma2 family endonuclease